MLNASIYRGRIVKMDESSGLPYVEVFDLGSSHMFGPLPLATAIELVPDDRVLVASIGESIEDLIVLGPISPVVLEGLPTYLGLSELDARYVNETQAGTVIGKDVPTSGNASSSQVVLGNDTRLTDARTPVAHTHLWADITDKPSTFAPAAHSHLIADLPVASSGTSNSTQLVRADDSRLSNARTPLAHTHGVTDLTATGTRNSTTFLRGDNTWATPIDTTYAIPSQAEAEAGTATTARAFTAERVKQAISAIAGTKERLASRGLTLVTNGTGLLGDNTNFSAFTYDATDAPVGARGSFDPTAGVVGSPTADELIPVDPNKRFNFSYMVKQKGTSTDGRFYSTLVPYDAYGSIISPQHYMFIPNTSTTLAAPLNVGDTTVTLTSSSNWYGSASKPAGVNTHYRRIIFWDYTDPGGKLWPEETYSRNVTAVDLWADGALVGNVITLSAPYAGPAKPAGTKLSDGSSGGTYMYGQSNVVAPSAWTAYDASVMGVVTGGGGASFSAGWPQGTAQCKIGWLCNRQSSGTSDTLSRHSFALVSFSEATAVAKTSILPGTGLTGGGTLVADRTLAVDFATSGTSSSTKAVRADDSRLSNSRAPSGTAGGDLTGSYPNPDVREVSIPDTRAVNDLPQAFSRAYRLDFKSSSTIGISDGSVYCTVAYYRPYSDTSAGLPLRVAYTDAGNTFQQFATSLSTNTWGPWQQIGKAGQPNIFGDDARLTNARTPVAHTHTSTDVTDILEYVQDTIGNYIAVGANLNKDYNDTTGVLTISVTPPGDWTNTDPEVVRDTIGGALAAGSNIDITVNDAGDSITISVIGLGTSATKNVGTTAGTVAAGDDSRIVGAAQKASNLSDLASSSAARTNLGLGTSAVKDVPASGNASATEVVFGTDTRLTDSRTPVAHTHIKSEITDLGTIGTAAALDVAVSGDAASGEVVKGNDSRLTDSRTPVAHTHGIADLTATGTPDSTTYLRGDGTWSVPSGSGDVVGPGSSTNNNVATFNGAGGKTIQDGGATVAQIRDRSTHTGTQSLDTTTDSATRVAMTPAERTKLSGVATGATANATDAQLRDRSTHTGTQAASTITGLDSLYLPQDSSKLAYARRAQAIITGGGTISVSASAEVSWTQRFICISAGNTADTAPNGFFNIGPTPAAGTVITGVGGASDVTVTAAGIALLSWQALYYILPLGSGSVFDPANLRVVSYTVASDLDDNWVLICTRNGDTTNSVKFASGQIIQLGKSWSTTWANYISPVIPGNPTLGDSNTSVTKSNGVTLDTGTLTTTEAYTNGVLTSVTEKNGATTIKTTTLNYTSGVLTSVVEVAGGTTVTTTLTYTSGVLTSTSKTVT